MNGDGYRCYDKECRCWAEWVPPTHGFDPHGTLITMGGRVWITPQVFRLDAVGMDWDGTIKPIGELS